MLWIGKPSHNTFTFHIYPYFRQKMTVFVPKVNEKERRSLSQATECSGKFTEVATAKHVAQMQQVGLRKDVLKTLFVTGKVAAKVPDQ
jgi:hypothetical protein